MKTSLLTIIYIIDKVFTYLFIGSGINRHCLQLCVHAVLLIEVHRPSYILSKNCTGSFCSCVVVVWHISSLLPKIIRQNYEGKIPFLQFMWCANMQNIVNTHLSAAIVSVISFLSIYQLLISTFSKLNAIQNITDFE